MDFIMEGLLDSNKDKVGKCSLAKEIRDKLHNIYSYPIIESSNAKYDADENSDEEESYRGMYIFFNCEESEHLEIECPYLKIEINEIERPIEIEDNSDI
jgi:hypothetical protein